MYFNTVIAEQVLPVQLGCLDVAEPVGVVGGEEEDVRRDEAVVLHPNDITHLKMKLNRFLI